MKTLATTRFFQLPCKKNESIKFVMNQILREKPVLINKILTGYNTLGTVKVFFVTIEYEVSK